MMKKDSQTYWNGLDQTQKDLIIKYTSGSSTEMNAFLRNGIKSDWPSEGIVNIKKEVMKLQNLLLKAPPLKNAIIVYRLFEVQDRSNVIENIFARNMAPIWMAKGFLSTSVTKNGAFRFMDDPKCCFGVVYLPPGTRGLFLSHSTFREEYEFLMPHGTNLTAIQVAVNVAPPVNYKDSYGDFQKYSGAEIRFVANKQNMLPIPSAKAEYEAALKAEKKRQANRVAAENKRANNNVKKAIDKNKKSNKKPGLQYFHEEIL